MELETESGKLSEPLDPCPQCRKPRERDRGDVANGLCWECRSRKGKVADIYLAAAEGERIRLPEYVPLFRQLRELFDDLGAPDRKEIELLDELWKYLRNPRDSRTTRQFFFKSKELFLDTPISEVLALVDELAGKKRKKKPQKDSPKKAGRPSTATKDKELAVKFDEAGSISMRAFAESVNLPESTCRTAVKRGKEDL